MIFLLLAFIFMMLSFGTLTIKERKRSQEQRSFVILGLTLATIATILTIISAIISIIIGIHVLTQDHFWWWFH